MPTELSSGFAGVITSAARNVGCEKKPAADGDFSGSCLQVCLVYYRVKAMSACHRAI